tara:strand:+ start:242 stop:433 length:192 start_codon:yes stop_codon:yes gene_type:complete
MADESFKKIVIGWLFNEERKAELIKKINDDINIPMLSEATEEKVFTAIWDAVEDVLKEAIMKD